MVIDLISKIPEEAMTHLPHEKFLTEITCASEERKQDDEKREYYEQSFVMVGEDPV